MKKCRMVTWEKHIEQEPEDRVSLLIKAVWESVSLLLLVFASISMLSKIAGEIRLGVAGILMLLLSIEVLPLYYHVGRQLILDRFQGKVQTGIRAVVDFLPLLFVMLQAGKAMAKRSEEIRSGFAAIGNLYFKYHNRIYGTTYLLEGQEEYIPYALCFGALLLFFSFYFMTGLLQGQRWIFLVFPGASTALLMNVGLAPNWTHVLFALLGAFLLFRQRSGKYWLKGALVASLIFCMALLFSGAFFAGMSEKLLSHSKEAKEFEGRLEKEMKSAFTGAFSFGKGNVGNDRPVYKDAKVMTVRLWEQPKQNLYFRDYYATNYESGGWKVSDQRFLQQCKEHGITQEQAASYLARMIYRSGAYDKATYQLKYQGAFHQRLMLPYGADYEAIKGFSYQGDYVTLKKGMENSFAFEGIIGNEFLGNQFRREDLLQAADTLRQTGDAQEKAFWDWYDAYVREQYLDTPAQIKDTRVYETLERVGTLGYYKIDTLGVQTGKAFAAGNPNRLIVALLISGYLRGEKISDMVYGNTLQSGFAYDLELDSIPEGEDPVFYFLNESRTGYCVHFASAGVLLLRAFGVPARYVSGYVVKPSAFVRQGDGSYEAEVVDRNAHAWAEVYLDGFGWIPVEMTAGYESVKEDLPTSIQAQQERKNAKQEEKDKESVSEETKEPEESAEPSDSSSQESQDAEGSSNEDESNAADPGDETEEEHHGLWGKSDSDGKNDNGGNAQGTGEDGQGTDGHGSGAGRAVIRILAMIILVLAVTAGIIWLVLYGFRKYQEKLENAIRKQYYRPAVLLMNRRIYKKIRRKGAGLQGIANDREYGEVLLKILGENKKGEVAEFLRIVGKAAFSHDKITKEECRTVLKVYRKIKE